MMKHLVDSATCLLIINTNRISISLLHRAQIAVKDAVLNFLQFGFLLEKPDVLAYSTLVMIEMG